LITEAGAYLPVQRVAKREDEIHLWRAWPGELMPGRRVPA
jgi:hypothetical protein